MDHIPTYLIKLPLRVRGLTSVDENGEPMIYLNDRLTYIQHKQTYDHELEHIKNDDLHNTVPIEEVENLSKSEKPPEKPPKRTTQADIIKRGQERYGLAPDAHIWSKLWEWWTFQHDEDIHLIINKELDGYSWHYFRRMAANIFKPWLEEAKELDKQADLELKHRRERGASRKKQTDSKSGFSP